VCSAYTAVQDKKVYVTGGGSPDGAAKHHVYVYDINTDQWGQLPPPGQYFGVPQIIGGKLAIIGGRLSATKQRTNKVSTFEETTQTWISFYPDLLSVRSKPGVVSHMEHVIVAGGINTSVIQDDIEVLNWIENSTWRKVSIKLPVPMTSFRPIISDGHCCIVGYDSADNRVYNDAYKIPVVDIIRSGDQRQASWITMNWITKKWPSMIPADHYYATVVPNLSTPVVVGGRHQSSATITTSDIKMMSSNSWRNVASLSSARCDVAVAAVNDNAIIVIGGCAKGGEDALSSSLATVELGQAYINMYSCCSFNNK